MKVCCLQERLAQALDIVKRAVSSRPTLPILQSVLVTTDDGRLRLSATNLEVSVCCWVAARVETGGAIAVPAHTFGDLVRAFPADQVRLGVTPDLALTLEYPGGKARIKGMDAKEFPAISFSGGNGIRLDAEALGNAISRVVFAASADGSRFVLSGVLLTAEGDRVTLVAADGFRLSVCTIPLVEAVEPYSVIVPATAMVEVGRLCRQPGPVALTVESSRVVFRFADAALAAQLIEGNFPDYRRVIPAGYESRIVVDTSELLRACRAAGVFARDAGHQIVTISVEPSSADLEAGRMVVAAASVLSGDGLSELDAAVVGQEIEIAFNVKYLIDALSVVGTPQVALEMTTASAPAVLRPVGEEDFTHVIMPVLREQRGAYEVRGAETDVPDDAGESATAAAEQAAPD